jgi:hypothetical protein
MVSFSEEMSSTDKVFLIIIEANEVNRSDSFLNWLGNCNNIRWEGREGYIMEAAVDFY